MQTEAAAAAAHHAAGADAMPDTSSLLQRLAAAGALLPAADLAPLKRAVQRAGKGESWVPYLCASAGCLLVGDPNPQKKHD